MSLYDYIKSQWQGITHQPTYIPVLPQNYVKAKQTAAQKAALFGVDATADKHYVRFVVTRMFLASTYDWLTTVSPAVYSSTNLHFGDHDVELSNLSGPKLLAKFGPLSQNKSLSINVPITGLFPFRGGDVRLACGLASIPGQNILKNFLDTVSEFATKLAQPQISLAISFASTIALGIQSLMEAGKAKLVLYLDNTYMTGQSTLTSGFVFLSDAPSGSIRPDQLWVIDDEPRIGPTQSAAKAIKGQNFMLLQVQVLSTRDDFNQFSTITEPLQMAKDARLMGNEKDAAIHLTTATIAVNKCPDLTTTDRALVIAAIRKEFDDTPRPQAMGLVEIKRTARPPKKVARVDLEKMIIRVRDAAPRNLNRPITLRDLVPTK